MGGVPSHELPVQEFGLDWRSDGHSIGTVAGCIEEHNLAGTFIFRIHRRGLLRHLE
jgi:hypothetical protein